MEEKVSTPAGDSAFLSELEVEVRTELTVAEAGPSGVAADAAVSVERLADADAEAYADAERYEVSLRTLLGAIKAVEDAPDSDH